MMINFDVIKFVQKIFSFSIDIFQILAFSLFFSFLIEFLLRIDGDFFQGTSFKNCIFVNYIFFQYLSGWDHWGPKSRSDAASDMQGRSNRLENSD